MQFNAQERAAVLAALRLLQACMEEGSWPKLSGDKVAAIGVIANRCGEIAPLNVDKIDDLCERINCEPQPKPLKKHTRDMHEMLVEEKQLLRTWAASRQTGPTNRDLMNFRADEINLLIEEGLPKRFRIQEEPALTWQQKLDKFLAEYEGHMKRARIQLMKLFAEKEGK